MLNKIDRYKIYHAAIDLIEREEAYDKKRSVITGEELFKLCHQRYILMQRILGPLKEKLGENLKITDISFTEGMQQEPCIIVEYCDNDKKAYFAVSNFDFDDIEIVIGFNNKDIRNLIVENKNLFIDVFKLANENNFDQEIHVATTSRKFAFGDELNDFILSDNYNSSIFLIFGKHAYYETMGTLYLSKRKNGIFEKVNQLLDNNENINSAFLHTRVYEEDIPKILIKK